MTTRAHIRITARGRYPANAMSFIRSLIRHREDIRILQTLSNISVPARTIKIRIHTNRTIRTRIRSSQNYQNPYPFQQNYQNPYPFQQNYQNPYPFQQPYQNPVQRWDGVLQQQCSQHLFRNTLNILT